MHTSLGTINSHICICHRHNTAPQEPGYIKHYVHVKICVHGDSKERPLKSSEIQMADWESEKSCFSRRRCTIYTALLTSSQWCRLNTSFQNKGSRQLVVCRYWCSKQRFVHFVWLRGGVASLEAFLLVTLFPGPAQLTITCSISCKQWKLS